MEKVQTSFYITKEIKDLVKFLSNREEITKTVFYRRAIRNFFSVNSKIDPRVMLTERSNPDYIRRDVLETMIFDEDQISLIEEKAERLGCSKSCVIFQALIDYCALLLTVDASGVEIKETKDYY